MTSADPLDDYEWDEGKRRENRDKHAIDFDEIGRVSFQAVWPAPRLRRR